MQALSRNKGNKTMSTQALCWTALLERTMERMVR